ncbi:hypothetical protein Pan97_35980 [Bremerella volcania]|uniref:DUF6798 domain-containing protein n=1 Tax=Bremerella volcania TaxID=2527984 RepID=A0A518CBF4_9BACT|nr:DUF6798 domain-containing protein [Bremerella volcania]QDU76546.1 hypothetical protein Pan97_35980 [Bremerella volcania]
MNPPTPSEPQEAEQPQTTTSPRWIELGLIVLLFFLLVGPLTPEVNEPHYLSKARHYWNPAWCPNDHFLNSGDAHGVFYWSFGWITTLVSFPVAAWIGRLICWGAIAFSWQRMIAKIDPRPWIGFYSIAAGATGIIYLHMAGEWLIGGVEAKCFAYAFAFWGLGDALSDRWNRAWILHGIASAFHVLVGGWMVVCLMFCWLVCPKQRPRLISILPGLLVGGAISLIGVMPLLLLNGDASPVESSWASYYYVYERLAHHLVVHTFAWEFKIRFFLAAIAWGITAWLLRDNDKLRILNGVVAGSVVLMLIGIIIDQTFFVVLQDWLTGSKLLRLYWYRIADVMVPLALAMNAVELCDRYRQNAPRRTGAVVAGLTLLVLAGMFFRIGDRWTAAASPADLSSLVTNPKDWEKTCYWIRDNTPEDAVFLTPRLQSTFKWYAQRAEVVTTKDVPQDDLNLLQWRERRGDTHWRSFHNRETLSLAGLTQEDLRELSRKYAVRFVVVDRDLARKDGISANWTFPRVYPANADQDSSYEVYEITDEEN